MKKYIMISVIALLSLLAISGESRAQAFLGRTIPQILQIHDSLSSFYVYDTDLGKRDSVLFINTPYYAAFCFISLEHHVCLSYAIVVLDSLWARGLEQVLDDKYVKPKDRDDVWVTPDGEAFTLRYQADSVVWKSRVFRGTVYQSMFKP